MQHSMRKAIHTRKLYSFENTFLRGCFSPLPMSTLQLWAHAICPEAIVRSGRGVIDAMGKRTSFACGGRIVLARQHRRLDVLLHELAHVMGSNRELDHGPTFRTRFFSLLEKYGGLDGDLLEIQWREYGN